MTHAQHLVCESLYIAIRDMRALDGSALSLPDQHVLCALHQIKVAISSPENRVISPDNEDGTCLPKP